MTTKTIHTKKGDTFEVKAALPMVLRTASRNLSREGVKVRATESELHENLDFQAEVCRLCLVAWVTQDGTEPLKVLKVKEIRDLFMESAGLLNTIFTAAKDLADAEAAENEEVAGN